MGKMEQYKVSNNQVDKKEEEIVNCVDEKGNIVGSIEREEGINNKILLQAVQLWIIHPKTKEVLMQRRSPNKENDPNMIDVSASGHVRKNELPIQAILREAFEELGVIPTELFPKLQDLVPIKIDLTKLGRKGNYVTHEYLAFLENSLSDYQKQDEEVAELFFMNYEELKEAIRNKEPDMRIPYMTQTEELFHKIDEKLHDLEKTKKKEIQK